MQLYERSSIGMSNLSQAQHRCISAALHCVETCRLVSGEVDDVEAGHCDTGRITLLSDCRDTLVAAARLMSRNSPNQAVIWKLATDCAADCAADCLRLEERTPVVLECAAACQRCIQCWEELRSIDLLTPTEPARLNPLTN